MFPTARPFVIAASIIGALLLTWSMLAPWAAAFPARPDHFKVSLFGVRHILTMEGDSAEKDCGWNGPDAPCQPAANGRGNYSALTFARWFVIIAFGLLVYALRRNSTPAFPLAAAGLCALIAILLVRFNVAQALQVFAGAKVSVAGSGIVAAEIATAVCFFGSAMLLPRRAA
jgi:hypothetical protein